MSEIFPPVKARSEFESFLRGEEYEAPFQLNDEKLAIVAGFSAVFVLAFTVLALVVVLR